MALKIRKATPADAADLARIHVEGWRAAYAGIMPAHVLGGLDVDRRTAQFRELIESPTSRLTRVWVAEEGGKVVGFAVTRPTEDDGEDPAAVGELELLYVDPAHKGEGIGKALLEKASGYLCLQDFSVGTLWTLEANAPARAFYEAQGWQHDGALREVDRGDHVTRSVRYRKTL